MLVVYVHVHAKLLLACIRLKYKHTVADESEIRPDGNAYRYFTLFSETAINSVKTRNRKMYSTSFRISSSHEDFILTFDLLSCVIFHHQVLLNYQQFQISETKI